MADESDPEVPSGEEGEETDAGAESDVNPYLADGVTRSWVLIHTDDCDAYGQDLEVLPQPADNGRGGRPQPGPTAAQPPDRGNRNRRGKGPRGAK